MDDSEASDPVTYGRWPTDGPVLLERLGPVAHVVLNRPQKRNAVSPQVAELLETAVRAIDADDSLAIGIISARGQSTFSAGADLNYVARGEGDRLSTRDGGFAGITRLPRTKPLIAAVHGHAVAGGFEIALACDLIVAERSARFALPEVQRGLIANGGGLIRLPRQLPPAVAADVILTGRTLTADEALRYGVVSRVVDDGTVLATALELARQIATSSPLAVQASLRIMHTVSAVPDEIWALCAEAARNVRTSGPAVHAARQFVGRKASS